VSLTLPRAARAGLKTAITFAEPMPAPIVKGQPLGKLTVTAPGMETKDIPLIAAADVPQRGFFARVAAKLRLFVRGS
jgi:D-alanyl-D-alanine carboxypeptidase (penicillin-binding protein 5/6)